MHLYKCIIFSLFYLEFIAKNKTENWSKNHVYIEVKENVNR